MTLKRFISFLIPFAFFSILGAVLVSVTGVQTSLSSEQLGLTLLAFMGFGAYVGAREGGYL